MVRMPPRFASGATSGVGPGVGVARAGNVGVGDGNGVGEGLWVSPGRNVAVGGGTAVGVEVGNGVSSGLNVGGGVGGVVGTAVAVGSVVGVAASPPQATAMIAITSNNGMKSKDLDLRNRWYDIANPPYLYDVVHLPVWQGTRKVGSDSGTPLQAAVAAETSPQAIGPEFPTIPHKLSYIFRACQWFRAGDYFTSDTGFP